MDDNKEVSIRVATILKIEVLEKLESEKDGVELNEGYQFEVDGPIPQLADAIAKMAFEMDKEETLGNKGGGAFLALVAEYYKNLTEGGTSNETTRV